MAESDGAHPAFWDSTIARPHSCDLEDQEFGEARLTEPSTFTVPVRGNEVAVLMEDRSLLGEQPGGAVTPDDFAATGEAAARQCAHAGEQRMAKFLAEITSELAWEAGPAYSIATSSLLSQLNDSSGWGNTTSVARRLSRIDPRGRPVAPHEDGPDGAAADGVFLSVVPSKPSGRPK